MYISVKANVRTASAARRSLVEAVQVAMRGGAVLVPRRRALAARRVGHLHLVRHAGLERHRQGSAVPDRWIRLRRLVRRAVSSSAAASTPRPPTSAPTSSARSRRASPRTTRATPGWSRTSSATTSATAPGVWRRPVRVDGRREHRRDDPRRRGLFDRGCGRLAEPGGLDLLPARRPRLRPPRDDRGDSSSAARRPRTR